MLVGAPAASAQGPDPTATPPPGFAPRNPVQGAVQTIVNIIQHVLVFPTRSIQEAIEKAFAGMLSANVRGVAEPLTGVLGRTILSTPNLRSDFFEFTWTQVRNISFLFWPLTLGLVALVVMKHTALAAGWQSESWGELVFEWAIVVLLAGTSLYWADGINRIANALTRAVLELTAANAAIPPEGLGGFVTRTLFGAAVGLATPGPTLLMAFVMAIMGFLILIALVMQYFARYALLFVLVSIAPLALLGEILPMTKWLSRLWVKGFVLVELLQPVNALLIMFTVIAVRVLLTGPGHVFVQFMVAAGVLSALITINYAVIRLTFSGIAEVWSQAAGTVQALWTLVASLVFATGGAALGGAAAGAAGGSAAGTVASGGGGAGAGGGGAGRLSRAVEAMGSVLAQGSRNRFVGGLGAGLRTLGLHGRRREEQAEYAAARQSLPPAHGARLLAGAPATTRDMERDSSELARPLAPNDPFAQRDIANSLVQLASARGPEGMAAMQAALPRAMIPLRNAVEHGGHSIQRLAEQAGHTSPGPFVRAQVEAAMARSHEPLSVLPTSAEPAWSSRPALFDYQRGYQIAEAIGDPSPRAAAAIGELYHHLRANTEAAGFTVAEGLVRDAVAVRGGSDATRDFVTSASQLLANLDLPADSGALVLWHSYQLRIANGEWQMANSELRVANSQFATRNSQFATLEDRGQMAIRFPRRIDWGYRPYKGLTIRQILYMVLGCTLAGILILTGSQDEWLALRVFGGLIIVGLAALVAFWRVHGRYVDAWVPLLIRHYTQPRRRIWKGMPGEPQIRVQSGAARRPVLAVRAEAEALEFSPLGVLLGFWIVLTTSAALVYLLKAASLRLLGF